jgi:hypothetical protein
MRRILFFMFSVILLLTITQKIVYSGEVGVKLWAYQIGTSTWDTSHVVATDSSDNIYVTGHTTGNLDGNINAGGYDIFLIKYDATGIKQWTRQIGTSSHDYGEGVATDSSGNIYVTGDTLGGLDGNINAGNEDIFLVKYAPSGSKVWTQQTGSTRWESGKGVSTDSNNNIYITGWTNGELDGNINAGSEDIFLIKWKSNKIPQLIWTGEAGYITDGLEPETGRSDDS